MDANVNESSSESNDNVLKRLLDESCEAAERLSDLTDSGSTAAELDSTLLSGTEVACKPEKPEAAVADPQQVTEVGFCASQLACTTEIPAVVYSKSQQELGLKQVTGILKSPNLSFISLFPPSQPSPGDVYVFPKTVDKTTRRCDHYYWIADGAKNLPRKAPIVKKHYFQARLSDGTKSKKFRKHEYQFLAAGSESYADGYVVVQYIGDNTGLNYEAGHGNQTKSERTYRRTTGTVKAAIQANKDTSPKKVYRTLVTGVKCSGISESVMKPRNKNQVRNFQKAARREQRISHDGLYNCLELALQFPEYIHYIQIHPHLVIHIGSSDMLDELERLFSTLQGNKATKVPQLQYDTTFALGDFYVSVLSFRHDIFEGSPVVPLAFMIHEKKFQKDHERFMESLKDRCKCLQTKKFVLVTDSEFEFSNIFPKVVSLHCWNHIRKNIRHWLQQNQATQDDMQVYSNHVLKLLQSETHSAFDIEYDTLSRSWSIEFKTYFDGYVKQKIVNYAGKWVVDEAGCYNEYSGITTNAAESFNNVLKDLSRWKERPVDALIVSLKCLQSFCSREIERGLHGLGEYVVREAYHVVSQPAELLPTNTNIKLPEEIVAFVKTGLESEQQLGVRHHETDSHSVGHSIGAEVLAKEAVDANKVVFVADFKSFMVEGSQGNKYAVTLFPKESCQCPALGTCYHILAAKCLMGMPIVLKKKVLNLSQLCKRKRAGRNKSSGRKKPRKGDYEVNPAPDSAATAEDGSAASDIAQCTTHSATSSSHRGQLETYPCDVVHFLKSAPADIRKRIKAERMIQLDKGEHVPRSGKGDVCCVNFRSNDAVLLNKTQVPAHPVVVVYSMSLQSLTTDAFIQEAASFINPDPYCKSVTVYFKQVVGDTNVSQVLACILQGKEVLKIGKTKQVSVKVVCKCRCIHLDTPEAHEQLMECPMAGRKPNCCQYYHTSCLNIKTNEAPEAWVCPICQFPEALPAWGSTKSTEAYNTCPFDNLLAATLAHVMEHSNCRETMNASNGPTGVLMQCMQEMIEGNADSGKDKWMDFLSSSGATSIGKHGKKDFHGSEWERFLKHFEQTYVICESSVCAAKACSRPQIHIRRNTFTAKSPEDIYNFVLSFRHASETLCSQKFNNQPPESVKYFVSPMNDIITGEESQSFCCASNRIVGPASFENIPQVWILPFQVGGLCGIDKVMQFPDRITLQDIQFSLACITLYSQIRSHFTALIAWKGHWLHYDGLRKDKLTWFNLEVDSYYREVEINYVIYMRV